MQIYKTTNIVNNKIYIGFDTKDRDDYLGSGKLIKRAIKKYGIENFRKEILEKCQTKDELCEREKFWIKKLNSYNPVGYNIANGGEGGDTYTNNSNLNIIKNKLSKIAKTKTGNKNRNYKGTYNFFSNYEKKYIKFLYEQCFLSPVKIGKLLKLSKNTVYIILNQLNVRLKTVGEWNTIKFKKHLTG
ncbi:MAG: hypothetical protein JETCAE03_34200 [Ignavibacteriaceae bacterium]|jgi:group I intron endonuclease|nr:MAG: hypothetical protein JETCAE03_34200 [Ignavibacteriaceae bacterium]